MAETEKRDLLLHYDEQRQLIIFYTVSVEDTEAIRAKEFDGVRLEIASLKSVSPEEAEKGFGSMAFSCLDLFALKKISIRDYAVLSAEAHKEYVSEIVAKAQAGDHEHQYYLFMERHSQALREANQQALDEAEKLLLASAAGGYPEAKAYLEEYWPLVKAAAERRIKRGPAA